MSGRFLLRNQYARRTQSMMLLPDDRSSPQERDPGTPQQRNRNFNATFARIFSFLGFAAAGTEVAAVIRPVVVVMDCGSPPNAQASALRQVPVLPQTRGLWIRTVSARVALVIVVAHLPRTITIPNAAYADTVRKTFARLRHCFAWNLKIATNRTHHPQKDDRPGFGFCLSRAARARAANFSAQVG